MTPPLLRPNIEVAADTIVGLMAAGMLLRTPESLRAAAAVSNIPVHAIQQAMARREHRVSGDQLQLPIRPDLHSVESQPQVEGDAGPDAPTPVPTGPARVPTRTPTDEAEMVAAILASASRLSNFTEAGLSGPSRSRAMTGWRQVAFAALRLVDPPVSFSAIGRHFARDHSTVMHGVERVLSDPELARKARAVAAGIAGTEGVDSEAI